MKTYPEKLSVNEIAYSNPSDDTGVMGPQRSVLTNSRGSVARRDGS